MDVGCGPGLLPALLAQRGCQAFGVDLAPEMFRPEPLHARLAVADSLALPFAAASFDLVTASNLLFLLADPQAALREIARTLRRGGEAALLNPSERLSEAAARDFADQRQLQGLARDTLINWGRRADAHHRWDENQLRGLFQAAGLRFVQSITIVGPGFARLARAKKTGRG